MAGRLKHDDAPLTSFRLVVRDGGISGSVLYDYKMTTSGGTGFAPSPHYAFLGTNYERYVVDTGTFPGMTVRKRPTSATSRGRLHSAARSEQLSSGNALPSGG